MDKKSSSNKKVKSENANFTSKDSDNTSSSWIRLLLSDPFFHSILFLIGTTLLIFTDSFLKNGLIYPLIKKLPLMQALMALRITSYIILRWLSGGKLLSNAIKQNTDLNGKIAVVTGGSSGIGRATVVQLLKWGATVIVGTRNISNIQELYEEILHEAKSTEIIQNLKFYPLELDQMDSVKDFANQILHSELQVHLLINNAGALIPEKRPPSYRDLDSHFTINHLGHFLLTSLLFNNIKKNNGRIINVSCLLHFLMVPTNSLEIKTAAKNNSGKYNYIRQFSFSKICNIWFTKELQRRLDMDPYTTATAYCCHPGFVKTNLTREIPFHKRIFIHLFSLLLKSKENAAATQLYLCAASNLKPGHFYSECKPSKCFTPSLDTSLSQELWNYSQELITPYS